MKNKFNLPLNRLDFNDPEVKKNFNDKLFTEVAPKYNFITKALSLGRDGAWKKMIIKRLPALKNANCLDIACGTGDISFLLAKKYKDGRILGVDLNEDMLNVAKKKRVNNNIEFRQSDMNSLNINFDSIDIVTGGYALRNSPDLEKTLKGLYRIMKKGATAAFLDFSKPKNQLLQRLEYFILKFWGGFWGLLAHGNPDVYGYIADSLKNYPDREAFKDLIIKTGFKNIKRKLLYFGMLEIISFEK